MAASNIKKPAYGLYMAYMANLEHFLYSFTYIEYPINTMMIGNLWNMEGMECGMDVE